MVDKLEGADIPSLTSKVNKLCPAAAANGRATKSVSGSIAPKPASKQPDMAAATEKVKKLVGSQPVMLFMKVGSVIPPPTPLAGCRTSASTCDRH